MAPTQEHPAKYLSAHICLRPFWNPVRFHTIFLRTPITDSPNKS